MAVEEKSRKLQSGSTSQKIFQIDDHMGVVAAGYIPDARMQVDQARVAAQSNQLVYDEIASVESVARKIADMAQQFTQYAGVRPFGVSLIIAGTGKYGPELFLTDPSGTYLPYNAIAIGSGSDQVTEYLEKNYNTDLSLEEACVLAAESIYLISEDKSGFDHIKMATVDMTTKKMKRLIDDEVEKIVSKAKNRETKSNVTKSE
jgi:proteasome alpha subunit